MAAGVGELPGSTLRFESVRYDYLPRPSRQWTEKEIDDELRENGIKVDKLSRGYSLFEIIGFDMELSPKISRGRFVVGKESSDANGEMIRGLVDYIAESIGSASGAISCETGRVVGLELNLNHLQAAYVGQEVTVIAQPLRQGSIVQVWEIKFETETIKDSRKETALIAVARLTLMVQTSEAMDKLATGSKL